MKVRFLALLRKFGGPLASPRIFYGLAMVILAVCIATILIWWLVAREKTQTLVLYSGQQGGTYQPLAEEIANLIEREHSEIKIEVRESEGSVANLRRLTEDERGHSLAIVQNDVLVPESMSASDAGAIRSLLPLHQGVVHFLVPVKSQINSIADLRGKVIAEGLRESGTPAIVDALLRHYEVSDDEVERRFLSLEDACAALQEGEVDAVILAMGLKSSKLEHLSEKMPLRLVGIGNDIDPGSEIEGFRLTFPFVKATYIPKYAYSPQSGNRPGIPDRPVATIGVRAVLVGHRDLPDLVANRIARTLVENKSSLARSHPSAAQITEQFDPVQLQFPIHTGAHRYFHRDDPGFLQKNAEVLGFLLSMLIALTGFLLSGRQWMMQRRKDRIDAYYIELDRLIDPIHRENPSLETLRRTEEKLREMQHRAIHQLANEKLVADESFRIFQVLLSEGRQDLRRMIEEKSGD